MDKLIPPYYAVIFCSQLSEKLEGYAETSEQMLLLAKQQAGFLGVDTVREQSSGITVSYWKDAQSIRNWQQQLEHVEAQQLGRNRWYEQYSVHVSRVERCYYFEAGKIDE